jgi:hypothetical protein
LRWLGYHRAWSVLKVGLAAAPLAPLVSPWVGTRLAYPAATTARIATVLTAVLLIAFLARALMRSWRQALGMLAAAVVAAAAAAHIIAARESAFFVADLLYEAAGVLLAMSAVGAGLRLARVREPRTVRVPRFSPQREVADMVTRLSAWVLIVFWICVAAGFRYLAAGVLFLLAGTIAVTLLLRMAEVAAAPRRASRPNDE